MSTSRGAAVADRGASAMHMADRVTMGPRTAGPGCENGCGQGASVEGMPVEELLPNGGEPGGRIV